MTRERHLARLRLLKRRIVVGSVLGFGTLIGLTARHTLGAKHQAVQQPLRNTPVRTAAGPVRTTFFDEHDAGAYSFSDPSSENSDSGSGSAPSSSSAAAPESQPIPQPAPPPIVQSSVS